MKKIKLLLDSNILLDFLNHRDPYFEDARLLMLCGRVGEFSLWASSNQITDIVYIASNGGDESLMPGLLKRMQSLRKIVNMYPVDEQDIGSMLATSWKDPEDALLHHLALKMGANAIITRDEGFKRSIKEEGLDSIEAFDCAELFDWIEAEYGINYAEIAIS